MKKFIELIARKPWLLIVAGFSLLISVWTLFMVLAIRNQPLTVIGF